MVTRGGQITAHFASIEGVNETTEIVITIWPNPASGLVSIEGVKASEMQVYNAFGQLVKTVRGTNEVDLSGFVEGIYLLRITTTNGMQYSNQIIVER